MRSSLDSKRGPRAMTFNRRTRRRAATADCARTPRLLIAAESLESRVLLSRTQFFVEDPRDTVFDAARNLLYVTTGHGTVERIDLATMTQLSPWAVGQSLLGADIDDNGSALYVAEGSTYGTVPQTGLTGGIVHQVNLRTGTVTDFVFPIVGQLEGLPMDVAAAANGKVYVTSQTAGSITALPLVEIDPATGATTRRQDLVVGTHSLLGRSADRRTLVAGTNG